MAPQPQKSCTICASQVGLYASAKGQILTKVLTVWNKAFREILQ
jgi:hypothetical protein